MEIVVGILLLCFMAFVLYGSLRKSKKYIDPRDKNYIPVTAQKLTDDEIKLLNLLNGHRQELGLPLLIPEELACQICKDALIEDYENGEYANHNGWFERIERTNGYGKEIFRSNTVSVEQMFDGYMKSGKHKKAIETPDATHIGIGIIGYNNYCLILKYN